MEWFEKQDIQKIDMIAGASLGAYVASEVLRLCPDFAEYALIESLKSYHYGRFMTQIFLSVGERMLRKAAGVEGIMDGSYQKDYISDDIKPEFLDKTNIYNKRIKESTINMKFSMNIVVFYYKVCEMKTFTLNIIIISK